MAKVAVLIENQFYENEIFYYMQRFPEAGVQVDFVSRLWGQDALTFKGKELGASFYCDKCVTKIDDAALAEYAAIIAPSGYVTDYLRYTEDVSKISPAVELFQRAFNHKNVVKGIICHGLWICAPIPETVNGRKLTCSNNLLGDAKNMGANYVDEDLVVDGDLITARTGGHANIFAKAIIDAIA